ncbi:MAG: hypothetical protein AAF492_25630, partial [Verrucomicrobiota bacterium]
YPRRDMLTKYFKHDNQPWLDRMKAQGFAVMSQGRSNYQKTLWSLSSMLNMDYIPALLPDMKEDDTDLKPLMKLYQKNRVFSLLRSRGYETHAFGTGYDLADLMGHVDAFHLVGKGGNNFEAMLMQLTPIPAALRKVGGGDVFFQQHRDRVHAVFERTVGLAPERAGRPRMVLSHIIAPHPPIVFGREGEPVQLQKVFRWGVGQPDGVSESEYRKAYSDQLLDLNRLLEEAAQKIAADATVPPVILIVSDHGLLNVPDKAPEGYVNNLCLARLPEQYTPAFYPEMTLVNLFPIVLKQLFGEDIPLKEDRSFLTSWEQPYRFKPVLRK